MVVQSIRFYKEGNIYKLGLNTLNEDIQTSNELYSGNDYNVAYKFSKNLEKALNVKYIDEVHKGVFN